MMWKEEIVPNKMHYPRTYWRNKENRENVSQESYFLGRDSKKIGTPFYYVTYHQYRFQIS